MRRGCLKIRGKISARAGVGGVATGGRLAMEENSREGGAKKEWNIIREKGYTPAPGFANSPADLGM